MIGQYHSNWLNMMMPRLYLAKNLLRRDGVIFVSIDDNEVHNLRLSMNEIFGEENFVCNFLWRRRQNADNRNQSNVSTDHEYVVVFSKSQIQKFQGQSIDLSKYQNPDNDPRGPWASIDLSGLATKDQRPNLHFRIINPLTGISYPPNPDRGWSKSKENILNMIEEGRILFPKKVDGRPREKKFLNNLASTSTGFSSWLDSKQVGFTTHGTRDVSNIMEGKYFDFPKPVKLLKTLFEQSTQGDDIILDFFAGSGTTAQAVMDLNKEDGGNRKYICVQLPELSEEKSEAFKAGYKTIADISKERIRRAGKKIEKEVEEETAQLQSQIQKLEGEIPTAETKAEIANLQAKIKQLQSQDLGFKVLKLEDSNFKQWRQIEGNDPKALAEQIKLFVDPVAESATMENMVYELLLKSGKDLNSNIKKEDAVYWINDRELVLLLEKATEEIIHKVIAAKPIKVIALDRVFKDNDQLKTNTVLQMRDAGIEFKTI